MDVPTEDSGLELIEAQRNIRALNMELAMHDDVQAQMTALCKKMKSIKERAGVFVNMIDKRIAYLCKIWEQIMTKKNDTKDIETARSAVNGPTRIGLNNDTDDSFFERVNLLKDKVAELVLLDEQVAYAHKRAAEDRRILELAAARLNDVENRQRIMLANNDNSFCDGRDPIHSLPRIIAAIDARLSSTEATQDEKTALEKLSDYIRVLRRTFSDNVSYSPIRNISTNSTTEFWMNSEHDHAGTGNRKTSSGISGTTISTNKTSTSPFTTSSLPRSCTRMGGLLNSKAKENNKKRDVKESTSTMTI